MSDDQVASYVQRVQRLQEEKRLIEDDIKEIYAEARSNGYDVKVLRAVVKHLGQDQNEVAEFDAIFDLYLQAVRNALAGAGAGRATYAREDRAKARMSESMADHKDLSAELAAAGLISKEAHAENVQIADGMAKKFGAGAIKTAADYRPHCQRPDACASYKLGHCSTCQRAIDAAHEDGEGREPLPETQAGRGKTLAYAIADAADGGTRNTAPEAAQ